jgi:hypothetical protein
MQLSLHMIAQAIPVRSLQWAVMAVGLVLTFALAYMLGLGQSRLVVMYVMSFILVLAIAVLQHRAWVLIPLWWAVSGPTVILPVPISMRELSILFATCAYITYRIVAHDRTRPGWMVLDVLIACNVAWLAITYVRNPVGLRTLGAETIGARPVFSIGLAFVAYWILVRLPKSGLAVARVPYIQLTGLGFVALLNSIAYFLPEIVPKMTFVFALFDVGAYFATSVWDSTLPRLFRFTSFGGCLLFILCAKYPPRTLLNPFRRRFYFLLLALAGILAGGYRSGFVWVFPAFFFGSWLWRGWREAVLVSLIGGLLVGGILIGQGRFFELPRTAQRAIAFLPGKWAPEVRRDIEGSTETRFDWWRTVWRENLIGNWWLGDGFGMSVHDWQITHRTRDTKQFEEHVILTGGYHSGPLSTIRYVGAAGLLWFYLFMAVAAVSAVRCVRQCRGTAFFPLAMFLAIQLLWWPVHFTLIYGAYNSDMPQFIYLAGLLRLTFRMRRETEVAGAPATPNLAPAWERAAATTP